MTIVRGKAVSQNAAQLNNPSQRFPASFTFPSPPCICPFCPCSFCPCFHHCPYLCFYPCHPSCRGPLGSPVPEREICCGLRGALSLIKSKPLKGPVEVGFMVTVIVQFPINRSDGQLLAALKSPVALMDLICSFTKPSRFSSRTVWRTARVTYRHRLKL